MKQTNLLKTFLLLCALVVGSTCAWADVSTLTFTSACGGSGTADDGTQWTVTSDGTESNYDSTKGIHYGTGSAQVKYITLSTNDISGTITKVVVNASTANGVSATVGVTIDGDAFGGDPQNLSSSATDYTFNGSASGEIVVTVTKPSKAAKALYVKSITVTYTTGSVTPTCATPTFDPAAGTYTSAQNVTISSTTEGATIYYTTNGEDPTTSSSVYSSAINVSTNTTIKAIAVKEGNYNSAVATATYQIVNIEHAGTEADPYTVADARTAIDANIGLTDVYATGIVSEIVTEWNTTFNNISFNISTDGKTTSDQLQAYRCVSTTDADASTVQVGDVVVIYGNLKKYNSTYEFDQNCQLVSLTTGDVRTTPTLSWSASEVEIDKGATDSEYTLPTLNNPQNVSPITYTITGTDNLAVEVDGNILVDTSVEGTVTVTASFAGDATYKPANASYTITVVDKNKKGTINNPYTVAEVIDGTATGTGIYVKGYIVGEYVGKSTNPKTSGFSTDANIALADEFTTSPTASGSIPVALPTDVLKNAWGCKTSNGALLGYEVLVKGNAASYFSVNGIKGTSEVTAVSVPVSISAAGLATFACGHALDFTSVDGIEAYIAEENGSKIELEKVNKVPAGTGVLLRSVSGAAKAADVPVATTTDDVTGNLFVRGTGAAVESGSGPYNYVLGKHEGKVGFYKAGGMTVATDKAYLQTTVAAARIDIDFDGDVTAIETVKSEKTNNEYFNLAGQRVANPTKGLYIVNGRKVVVK